MQYKAQSKLPSDYLNAIKANKDAQQSLNKVASETIKVQNQYTESQKEEIRLSKAVAREKAKLAKSQSQENKELINLRTQKNAINKQLREESKAMNETLGLYDRVNKGISSLTKQYNDLAIRKELNGKLSAEEQVTLGKLEGKLNKYQTALKNVDQRIGNHRRNVGNYKSTFDGLGFSVAQITRELPAFANSMQTGFMAISNNIPILADEIGRLTQRNKELAASGKPTTNVLKAVGRSIFSLQSLLSIGVTLLTVYGAKLVETIFPTNEAEKATEEYNKDLEEQNKQLKENIELRNRQIQEARNFINDPNLSGNFLSSFGGADNERAGLALVELSERLQKIGVENAEILKDDKILQEDRVRIAVNLLEIESQKAKLDQQRTKINDILIEKNKILKDFEEDKISATERDYKLRQLSLIDLRETLTIQGRIKQLNEANQAIIAKTVELKTQENGSRQQIQALELESEAVHSLRLEVEKQISQMEEIISLYPKGSQVANHYTNEIHKLKTALEGLGKIDVSDAIAESQMVLDSILRPDVEGDGLDNWQQYFTGIVSIGQQAFNLLDTMSRQRFEREFSRLEQQKDYALKFAGESAEAREEIERQYEDKRRAIQTRQAKAERDQSIFNIILDTAQGVVQTIANLGLPAAIPFISAIGAIGIANLAIARSTPIPQFKDGVRDFSGGLAVVGDGGKSEVITTPDGKVVKTPSKDTLVNLPKGSNVYSSENEFEKELQNIYASNGIIPYRQQFPSLKTNSLEQTFTEGIKDLKKAIVNKPTNGLNIDNNGFTNYILRGNTKTLSRNNRITGKGFNV